MNDIRSTIFTSKWIEALDNRKFSEEDLIKIQSFFLNNDSSSFFETNEEGIQANETYKKFIEELNFPDILSLDRFRAYPPEKQFYDKLDEQWGINFETVDVFRRLYLSMVGSNNYTQEETNLILEEVYNPLFRKFLFMKYDYNLNQDESVVAAALKNGVSIENLQEMSNQAAENVNLTSSANLSKMVYNQIRDILKASQ